MRRLSLTLLGVRPPASPPPPDEPEPEEEDPAAAGPPHYEALLDGEWVSPAGDPRLAVRSPADRRAVLFTVAACGDREVQRAVRVARRAVGSWGATGAAERVAVLREGARLIAERKHELSRMLAAESGWPRGDAREDVAGIAAAADFACAQALAAEGRAASGWAAGRAAVELPEPVGVVVLEPGPPARGYALNFVGRALTALAAGCAVIVHPHPGAVATTVEFARLLSKGGVPVGALNVLPGDEDGVAELLAACPDVDMLVVTGAAERCARLAARCAAHSMTRVAADVAPASAPTVLVCADADPAEPALFDDALLLAGGLRVAAHVDVADAVEARLAAAVGALSVVGPLPDEAACAAFVADVDAAVDGDGGALVCGGSRDEDGERQHGCFVRPALVTGLGADAPAWRAALRGPGAVVARFRTEDQAARLASTAAVGSAVSVWCAAVAPAMRLARRVRAAAVFVNAPPQRAPEIAVGARGLAGGGRTGGRLGYEAFVDRKVVVLPM